MGEARIDDRDSSITYEGSWLLGGREVEYNSTTHGTTALGASATLLFKGTSVSVFGTLEKGALFTPTISYSIDGSTESLRGMADDDVLLFRQLLYKSSGLDPSITHTLIIEFQVPQGNKFWLDYLEVEEGTTTRPPPQSSQSSQSKSSTSSPSPMSPVDTSKTQGQSPTSSTTPSPITPTLPAEGQNSLSSGTIAGITVASVVGSVSLVVIIGALFVYLRRRGRTKPEELPNTRPTPFPSAFNSSSTTTRFNPPAYTLESSSGGSRSGVGYAVHGGLSNEKAFKESPDRGPLVPNRLLRLHEDAAGTTSSRQRSPNLP